VINAECFVFLWSLSSCLLLAHKRTFKQYFFGTQIYEEYEFYIVVTFRNLNIKDVRSQGERVCPMRTFCRQGGSSDAYVRTFWCKKLRIFRNLWCVRTVKGVEPVRTFFGQGGGVNFFSILCLRSLWMASYIKYSVPQMLWFFYPCITGTKNK